MYCIVFIFMFWTSQNKFRILEHNYVLRSKDYLKKISPCLQGPRTGKTCLMKLSNTLKFLLASQTTMEKKKKAISIWLHFLLSLFIFLLSFFLSLPIPIHFSLFLLNVKYRLWFIHLENVKEFHGFEKWNFLIYILYIFLFHRLKF